MDFETPVTSIPFNPEEQVQLCSIDLRVSREFWRQKKVRYPIDLHRSKIAELSPLRHWKKIILTPDQAITLNPYEFILGHTYEKFTIPDGYAGKACTRSSFARLGVEINSASDFLNPGWRGYLPLEIINKSKNSIKLYPYMSIMQIMIIPLSSAPDKKYGEEKLGSKYQNDDGGPSRWWREKLYEQIRNSNDKNVSNEMLEILISEFKNIDDLGLYRFEKFFEKLKVYEIDNADNLIDKFAKKEKVKARVQGILLWLIPALQTALIGLSLKLLLDDMYKLHHYVVWVFTVFWVIPTVFYVFIRDKVNYFDKK